MHPQDIRIAEHTYTLPPERIARFPLAMRDESKLLVYRDDTISDHTFNALPDLLPPNTLLLLNDTRVVHARLQFTRASGARIEVFCLRPADGIPVEVALNDHSPSAWQCIIGNAKKWKVGEELELRGHDILLCATRTGTDTVQFSWNEKSLQFAQVLEKLGNVPLPPYMQRSEVPEDELRYNTVFAQRHGSVAAPTASLHFTPELLTTLADRSIKTGHLTLHVGAGTFLPVKSDTMGDHRMHQEEVSISLETLLAMKQHLDHGSIIAGGTTALRTAETIYWHGRKVLLGQASARIDVGQWEPYADEEGGLPGSHEALDAVIDQVQRSDERHIAGTTGLLIAPGYPFRFVNGLITNFHQPQSTLLLLVAAFIGPEWKRVYAHALESGYRFLSYGDASLLFRRK